VSAYSDVAEQLRRSPPVVAICGRCGGDSMEMSEFDRDERVKRLAPNNGA